MQQHLHRWWDDSHGMLERHPGVSGWVLRAWFDMGRRGRQQLHGM
jgi:hypothetical protein